MTIHIRKMSRVRTTAAASLQPWQLRTLAEVEREHMLNVLAHCKGRTADAAKVLGVSVRTVQERLKAWGIRPRDYK